MERELVVNSVLKSENHVLNGFSNENVMPVHHVLSNDETAMPQGDKGWSSTLGDVDESGVETKHCAICREQASGVFFGATVCLPCKVSKQYTS